MQEITLAGAPVRTIGDGVIDSSVVGVAANADSVFVSASSEESGVFVFHSTTGNLMRSLGGEGGVDRGLEGLRITADDGHILVTDIGNDVLLMFTLSGEFVRGISVDCASDLDFATNGDIITTNLQLSCVCVYSSDGSTLLRSFGSYGYAPGQFNGPTALAMLRDELYVLDYGSARVQVFK